jgi:membrane protein DedA with SNARE-associated domain
MDNLLDNFGHFISAYPTWRFFIVAGISILQGELAILLSLYLIKSGILSWPVFIGATLGGICFAETFLYILARAFRRSRFGWRWYYKIKNNRRLQIYTYFLKTNMTKIFIITKFIPAMNFLIIFLAGWSKTKAGQFFKAYVLSILIWFTGILAIAYPFTSGLYYLRSAKIFRETEVGIVLLFTFILILEYFLRRFLHRISAVTEKSAAIGEYIDEEIEKRRETKNLTSDNRT